MDFRVAKFIGGFPHPGMLRRFATALFFLVIPVLVFSQSPDTVANPAPVRVQESTTGFFIVMSTKKNCPNKIYNMDGNKPFCVTKEPIISVQDFEQIGEVKYDIARNIRYLVLKLTVDGFKTLKVLTEKLPDTDLALVIDGKVAGIFDNPDKIVNRNINIIGENAIQIVWIHDQLKKVKP